MEKRAGIGGGGGGSPGPTARGVALRATSLRHPWPVKKVMPSRGKTCRGRLDLPFHPDKPCQPTGRSCLGPAPRASSCLRILAKLHDATATPARRSSIQAQKWCGSLQSVFLCCTWLCRSTEIWLGAFRAIVARTPQETPGARLVTGRALGVSSLVRAQQRAVACRWHVHRPSGPTYVANRCSDRRASIPAARFAPFVERHALEIAY